jgi:hypothetical protein
MHRIDTTTAVGVLPVPNPVGAPGYFAHAPAGSGVAPTVVSSDWANAIQEEIAGVVEAAGIALDKTNHAQLGLAIQTIGANSAGSLWGMTTSNTPGLETTSVSIAIGQARDASNTANIVLAAPIAKLLTAVWAAGNGAGGRDSGAPLANGQSYHVFVILNPTTGAVDALFSQSPHTPTMPAGFTKWRRVGAILLDAAATTIRAFVQYGDDFWLKLRSTDFAATANGGGVAFLRKISVPAGIKLPARCYFQSTGTANTTAYLSGLFDANFGVPPAFGGATQWAQVRRGSFLDSTSTPLSYGTVIAEVTTDTNQQIYTFSSDNLDVIALGVIGWKDARGRLG